MRAFFRRPTALIAIGLVAGLLLAPIGAEAAGSIAKLFNQLKPKMDARYVVASHEAYALVTPGGPALSPARTKGFSSVSRVGIGDYCLTPTASLGNIDNRVFMTSPEYQNSSGQAGDVFWLDTTNDASCAQGLVEIRTFVNGVASDDVAFSVYSPAA